MRHVLTVAALCCATAGAAAQNVKPVTIDNYVRAETDFVFADHAKKEAFGRLNHRREPVDIDNQPVIRTNRDTLYSLGLFDITSPLKVTMPKLDGRFQSLRVIDEDHYIVQDTYQPGTFELSADKVGTRYVLLSVRTLANPDDPKDMAAAHAAQDAIVVLQKEPGKLDFPNWDNDSREKLKQDLVKLAPWVPDSRHMFGSKEQVDEVRHLVGTAGGWGGGSEEAVLYINVTPEKNDGTTLYALTVGDVPVDGFWSISVYNAKGYFQKSEHGGLSTNNVIAAKNRDNTITVHFGGDPKAGNYLAIMPGWNYTVRLYRPRKPVLDGSWTFPKATPVP